MTTRPVVLTFSGHDPTGGAGMQADIEALSAHGCHAVGIITALTEQDTVNVKKLVPQSPQAIIDQAETLLNDLSVQAFKIGLLGHPSTASAIHSIVRQYPDVPVVFDPVLAAGGGTELASDDLIAAIQDCLLPCTTVLTPNSLEVRKLAGLADLNDCAAKLLAKGCDYVLITGTHEASAEVSNRLYHQNRCIQTLAWPRLPGSYHGSGCTLAAAIAGMIARGLQPESAIAHAQRYTWQTLKAGYRLGKGQLIPDRFFAAPLGESFVDG
jgi:hydroxymethylpyrimidine/phosphomethylpyrimidine kinase